MAKTKKKDKKTNDSSHIPSFRKINFLLQAANIVQSAHLSRFYTYTTKMIQKKLTIRSYATVLTLDGGGVYYTTTTYEKCYIPILQFTFKFLQEQIYKEIENLKVNCNIGG